VKSFRASLLAIPLLACAPSPKPCMSPGTCPEGSECLANRCTLLGADPVPGSSRRLVSPPSAMALVTSRGPESGQDLPATVTFGGGAEGAAALYLRFPAIWRGAGKIASAFVVLEPMPATRRGRQDVTVHVWRVGSDWQPGAIGWLAQPPLSLPRASGIARSAPPLPLRIDVTALFAYFAEHPSSDHGIALKASAGDDAGSSFALGTSGGSAPRLELYLE
jgi:hypothetical protein